MYFTFSIKSVLARILQGPLRKHMSLEQFISNCHSYTDVAQAAVVREWSKLLLAEGLKECVFLGLASDGVQVSHFLYCIAMASSCG